MLIQVFSSVLRDGFLVRKADEFLHVRGWPWAGCYPAECLNIAWLPKFRNFTLWPQMRRRWSCMFSKLFPSEAMISFSLSPTPTFGATHGLSVTQFKEWVSIINLATTVATCALCVEQGGRRRQAQASSDVLIKVW